MMDCGGCGCSSPGGCKPVLALAYQRTAGDVSHRHPLRALSTMLAAAACVLGGAPQPQPHVRNCGNTHAPPHGLMDPSPSAVLLCMKQRESLKKSRIRKMFQMYFSTAV